MLVHALRAASRGASTRAVSGGATACAPLGARAASTAAKPTGAYTVVDHTFDAVVVGAGGAGLVSVTRFFFIRNICAEMLIVKVSAMSE